MQPGAQRVLCAATREALECTAAVTPDGSVAVVLLNRSDAALPFTLRLGPHAAALTLDAHALLTVCVAGPASDTTTERTTGDY